MNKMTTFKIFFYISRVSCHLSAMRFYYDIFFFFSFSFLYCSMFFFFIRLFVSFVSLFEFIMLSNAGCIVLCASISVDILFHFVVIIVAALLLITQRNDMDMEIIIFSCNIHSHIMDQFDVSQKARIWAHWPHNGNNIESTNYHICMLVVKSSLKRSRQVIQILFYSTLCQRTAGIRFLN